MNKPFYKKIVIELDENNCSLQYIEQTNVPVKNPIAYNYKAKRKSSQDISEFYKEAYNSFRSYLSQIENDTFLEEFKKAQET